MFYKNKNEIYSSCTKTKQYLLKKTNKIQFKLGNIWSKHSLAKSSWCVNLLPADVFTWLLLPGEHRTSALMWVAQAHLNNMNEREHVGVKTLNIFWSLSNMHPESQSDLPWSSWPLLPLWAEIPLGRRIAGEISSCWGLGLGGNSLHHSLWSSSQFSWTSCHCKTKICVNHLLSNKTGYRVSKTAGRWKVW